MATKASGIKALIFDIDDTLFDRKTAQKKMLELFRREYEEIFEGIKDDMVGMAFLEADRLSTEAFFASGSIDSVRIGRFRIFLNMLGIEEEFAEEMALKYIESYSQIKAEVHEAKTILETLAKNYNGGKEYHWGRFTSIFHLPAKIRSEKADVNFENGLLKIRAPKEK